MWRLLKTNPFLQALVLVGVLYIIWTLRAIVLIVFVAFLLTTTIYPFTRFLKRHRWPSPLAAAAPVFLTIAVLILVFSQLLPPIIGKFADFLTNLPGITMHAAHQLGFHLQTGDFSSLITGRFGNLSHFAFALTATVVRLLAEGITVVVLTIYWLNSYDTVQRTLLELFRGSTQERAADIWRRIEHKLGAWLQAHLILNTVVGSLVWVALTLIGVPFADILAIIAFALEIIPGIGPIAASVPAIALGLSQSLTTGLVVAGAYLLIQQLENHILSPVLLGKSVQLHPMVIIIALLIGAETAGIIGALIAVPVSLCISAAVDSWRGKPLEEHTGVIGNAFGKLRDSLRR